MEAQAIVVLDLSSRTEPFGPTHDEVSSLRAHVGPSGFGDPGEKAQKRLSVGGARSRSRSSGHGDGPYATKARFDS